MVIKGVFNKTIPKSVEFLYRSKHKKVKKDGFDRTRQKRFVEFLQIEM